MTYSICRSVARGTLNIERKPLDLGRLWWRFWGPARGCEPVGLHLEGTFEPGLWVNADATRMKSGRHQPLVERAQVHPNRGAGHRAPAAPRRQCVLQRRRYGHRHRAWPSATPVRAIRTGAGRASRPAGMGIGLSIVRSLVELHGGAVFGWKARARGGEHVSLSIAHHRAAAGREAPCPAWRQPGHASWWSKTTTMPARWSPPAWACWATRSQPVRPRQLWTGLVGSSRRAPGRHWSCPDRWLPVPSRGAPGTRVCLDSCPRGDCPGERMT